MRVKRDKQKKKERNRKERKRPPALILEHDRTYVGVTGSSRYQPLFGIASSWWSCGALLGKEAWVEVVWKLTSPCHEPGLGGMFGE
jgi:hypothetical protein